MLHIPFDISLSQYDTSMRLKGEQLYSWLLSTVTFFFCHELVDVNEAVSIPFLSCTAGLSSFTFSGKGEV